MKQFFTFAVALLVTLTLGNRLYAGVANSRVVSLSDETLKSINAKKIETAHPLMDLSKLRAFSQGESKPTTKVLSSKPMKVAPENMPITEQPEGTLKSQMFGKSEGYWNFMGNLLTREKNGTVNDIVVGDDGSIYIKNPFSCYKTGTWLKGIPGEGNIIEVNLPQPIYYQAPDENYDELLLYAAKMNIEAETGWATAVMEPSTVQFTWEDGTLNMLSDRDVAIGMVSETGEWTGYGDWLKHYHEVKDLMPFPMPWYETETYRLSYIADETNPDNPVIDDSKVITIARDNNEVWVTGLAGEEDIWIYGKIENGSLKFAKHQYAGIITKVDELGLLGDEDYHAYFFPLDWETDSVYFVDQNFPYDKLSIADEIEFNYDQEENTFTCNNKYLAFIPGEELIYDILSLPTDKVHDTYFYLYKHPVLSGWKDIPGIPVAPTLDELIDYRENGYIFLRVKLGIESLEGKKLNQERLYWNITLNNNEEPYTFKPENNYINLTSEITEVPYTFNSYLLFPSIMNDDLIYCIYLNETEVENFTINTYCVDDNGQRLYSEPLRYEVAGSESAAVERTVIGREYYDLNGNLIENPATGIFIEKIHYENDDTEILKKVFK